MLAGSFQLNLQLNSEEGDLTSFVMNGEWAILGKAPKDPFSVFVTFPAFSRLAVDLTLYRRPVFDTLTKVSSSRNIYIRVQKYDICIQNQISGGLITFDKGLLDVRYDSSKQYSLLDWFVGLPRIFSKQTPPHQLSWGDSMLFSNFLVFS